MTDHENEILVGLLHTLAERLLDSGNVIAYPLPNTLVNRILMAEVRDGLPPAGDDPLYFFDGELLRYFAILLEEVRCP